MQTLRSGARALRSFLLKNTTDAQTVAKNTVWLAISNFGGRLLKALVIIYAARVLDPSGLGLFSYAVTLAGFLTFFVDPGINALFVREGSKRNEAYRAKLLTTLFYLKLALIALAALFVLWVGPYFTTLSGAALLLPVAALVIVGDTLREFFSSLIWSKEKMERGALVYLFTNLCIVAFGLAALRYAPSALSFGWAYTAGTSLGALFAVWAARPYLKKLFSGFSFELLWPIARSAWPFAVTGTLGILLTNTDILIISWLRSASDVGIYSAAVRIIQLLYLVPVVVQYATLPLLSRLAAQSGERFRAALEQILVALFAVSLPLALGGILLAGPLMQTVFGAAYAAGALPLGLMMLSMVVDYPGGVLSLGLFAYDKQKNLVTASLIGGVTNVAFDLLLIPHFGIAGSAVATLVAQVLNNAYLWRTMKRTNYFSILPQLTRILCATAAMGACTAVLMLLRTDVVLTIVVSSICYAALLVLFKEPLLLKMRLALHISSPGAGANPQPQWQNGSVRIGGRVISVEVAKDTPSIRAGLAGRDELGPEQGMLFVFAAPKRYKFWMRGMRFPLDIIWICKGAVVGVTRAAVDTGARPHFYRAPRKADCVLEVNAGFAEENAIKAGDLVEFDNVRPALEIAPVPDDSREAWNRFILENEPPVGAFMNSWEWGDFQKKLGFDVERYRVAEAGSPVAQYTLVRHALPFGLSYGYLPRGPLIARTHEEREMRYFEILQSIERWARKKMPSQLFLRMEPPLAALSEDTEQYGFRKPPYTIQPPYNTVVPLPGTEADISKRFHPSTCSNLKRAERRGVTVEMKSALTAEDYEDFFSMIQSTTRRMHGTNAYPSEEYLRTFLSANRILGPSDPYDPAQMSLGVFFAYHFGEPAAMEVVVFFGRTATYLFGASNAEHLSSKASTYLHWSAMRDAQRRGMRQYDLGGIDERIWPSLTTFKLQFGGENVRYIGNIDVSLQPLRYRTYNLFRKLQKKMRQQA